MHITFSKVLLIITFSKVLLIALSKVLLVAFSKVAFARHCQTFLHYIALRDKRLLSYIYMYIYM